MMSQIVAQPAPKFDPHATPVCLHCGAAKPADGKLFCDSTCKAAYAAAVVASLSRKAVAA